MVAASNALLDLIGIALVVFEVVLFARVVMSWLQFAGVHPPTSGPLRSGYELLFDITEPVLRPIRKIVPPAGMFDLSVVVAFLIVFVLQQVLASI
jgi:YggT family protein